MAPKPRVLSMDDLIRVAYQAGFRGQALVTIVAIAYPESGGNQYAHNPNRKTGDNSYGLWQINMIDNLGPERRKQFGISSNEELWDPLTNAKAAFKVSGGGKNFKPWTTYKNNKHQSKMSQVANRVTALQADGSIAAGFTGLTPDLQGAVNTQKKKKGDPTDTSIPVPESMNEMMIDQTWIRSLMRNLMGQEPTADMVARYAKRAVAETAQIMEEVSNTPEARSMRFASMADVLRGYKDG